MSTNLQFGDADVLNIQTDALSLGGVGLGDSSRGRGRYSFETNLQLKTADAPQVPSAPLAPQDDGGNSSDTPFLVSSDSSGGYSMNTDLAHRRAEVLDVRRLPGAVMPSAAVAAPPSDPMKVVHRTLRGRYKKVAMLAAVGLIAGAAVGYKFGAPSYRSEGLVRIAYLSPASMGTPADKTPREMPMTMFDAQMRAQQLTMGSEPMVAAALEDPAWRSVVHGPSATDIKGFADSLKIEHTPQTDMLHVYFTDSNPQVAAAAVRAIINTYSKTYNEQEKEQQKGMINALNQRGDVLGNQLQNLEGQMTSKFGGVGDVEVELRAAQARQSDLASRLSAGKRLLALAQSSDKLSVSALLDQIGTTSPEVVTIIQQRQLLLNELTRLKSHGMLDSHVLVKGNKAALDDLDDRLKELGAQLASSVDQLTRDYKQSTQEVEDLSSRRMKGEALRSWLDQVGKNLADVTARAHSANMEDSAGSRLSVISAGDVPMVAFKDRRMMMIGGGALFGAILPAGLLVLMGIMRPRYRFSDNMEADLGGRVPVLGVLPVLNGGLSGVQTQAETAYCIHQIRVMLQVGMSGRAPAFLMTSAAPGEGKTALTAALGLSYAMSGSRTLIIDADLVGRSLTHGHNFDGFAGLHEALVEGTVNGFARETTTPGLFILPAGQTDVSGASRLSLRPIQQLLNDAREQFDIVLIDSGPILGSVEASVIAQETDGVIFVVAHGQEVSLVKKAMEHLRSVGASIAGTVFNRADPAELRQTGYAASRRSWKMDVKTPAPQTPANKADVAGAEAMEQRQLGPLARSVQYSPEA